MGATGGKERLPSEAPKANVDANPHLNLPRRQRTINATRAIDESRSIGSGESVCFIPRATRGTELCERHRGCSERRGIGSSRRPGVGL